jgi:hypothetical protein
MLSPVDATPWRLLLLVLAGAAAACSLVYSSDLGGARAVPDPVSKGDEAGARDASPREGGSSGAALDDAGSFVGCANLPTTPKFCSDFDGPGDPLAGWQVVRDGPIEGQVVESDNRLFVSSPRSLLVRMVGVPLTSYTRVERVFPTTGSERLEVRAKLRPLAPWAAGTRAVVALGLDMATAGSCQSLLYLNAKGAGTDIGSAEVNMQAGPDLDNDVRPLGAFAPVDEWSEYRVTAVNAPEGISVTYDIVTNGRPQTTVYAYPRCHLGGRLEVAIGFHYQGGSLEMHFDDIVVDWR